MSEPKSDPTAQVSYRKKSQAKEVWRRMKKNKPAMAGLAILICFALVAIFADVIVPYEKGIENNAAERLLPPSWEHPFGTDAYGRDCFARIVHGSRVSLTIGLTTTAISLAIGGSLGAIVGYYGGWIDSVIMRTLDIINCIPGLLLSLTVIAAFGPSLQNVLIAIAIGSIPSKVRLVRATVLSVVEQDYIEAARSYGASDARIIYRYILPNAIGPIIVNTTMSVAGMILAAASLSFIGLGIQPPAPEWGAMLSDARQYIWSSAYLIYFPGLAILLSALSLNLLGDGLRDALDPKLKD
jgi:peptide/nickel transport system permease protein